MKFLPLAESSMSRTRWRRFGLILAVALVAPAMASLAAHDPGEMAKERCSAQLTYQISLEAGGSMPDSGLDRGQAQVRRVSDLELAVTGNAWYRRDRFDRGRPYTYDCTFDMRSGSVVASYRWVGPFVGADDNFQPGGTPNGRVIYSGSVINVKSGKALDVASGSKRDGANVSQFTFRNTPNQLWDVIDAGRGRFVFVNQRSDKVLDVAGGVDHDQANVQQYRYNGSDGQLWRIERVGGGAFQIVNVGSDKCLDVQGGNRADSVNVQQYKCLGSPNQAWRLGQ